MPTRRLTAPDILAPNQEISVNPYSSYNSDNVNALSRMITGEPHKDFVTNGLELTGTPYSFFSNAEATLNEVLSTPAVFDETGTISLSDWENSPVQTVFDDVGTEFYRFTIPNGAQYGEAYIKRSYGTEIDSDDIGSWFKITFEIANETVAKETPTTVSIFLGGNSYTYKYPCAGTYTVYLQLVNYLNSVGEENGLKISAVLDSTNPYSCSNIYIGNIRMDLVQTKGGRIEAITDPDVLPVNIPEALLHPHKKVWVNKGVCIKDEAVVTLMATGDSSIASKLEYNSADSWIKNNPYEASDFTGTTYFMVNSIPTAATFTNGVLTDKSYDDVDSSLVTPRKINGDSRPTTVDPEFINDNPPVIKWAYICVYYSFYKNPNPNKAYIGLARPEDVEDPRFGEDYLVLGLCRMIDKETCDAIFLYPDGFLKRQDWGFIDATRVTYKFLNDLLHWGERPSNASLALDMLASKIFNYKSLLYFPTHSDFTKWQNMTQLCGTGHGPQEYKQWTQGQLHQNGYDQVAYVVQTGTFWRSKIKTKIEDNVEVADKTGNEYLQIEWYEITHKRFEINWQAQIDGDDWTTVGTNWKWYNGTGDVPADDNEITPEKFQTIITNSSSVSKTLAEAKAAWPTTYYVSYNGSDSSGVTIVNPYNIYGSGSVPGPTDEEVQENKFLRSDNTWKSAGALDIHFEAKGYLMPVDNLVQGMCGHNGVLKGIHLWTDTPITQPTDGLRVDVLLTKHFKTTDPATATAPTIDGVTGEILSIGVGYNGSGYIPTPSAGYQYGVVQISDPTGYGAEYTIKVNSDGEIDEFIKVSGGLGYTNPTITIKSDFFITASIFNNDALYSYENVWGIDKTSNVGLDLSDPALPAVKYIKDYESGSIVTLSDFNTGSDIPNICL